MVESPVHRRRPSALESVFGKAKAIIGVIHSRALPGSPDYEGEAMEAIYAYAVAEAERYAAGDLREVYFYPEATFRS